MSCDKIYYDIIVVTDDRNGLSSFNTHAYGSKFSDLEAIRVNKTKSGYSVLYKEDVFVRLHIPALVDTIVNMVKSHFPTTVIDVMVAHYDPDAISSLTCRDYVIWLDECLSNCEYPLIRYRVDNKMEAMNVSYGEDGNVTIAPLNENTWNEIVKELVDDHEYDEEPDNEDFEEDSEEDISDDDSDDEEIIDITIDDIIGVLEDHGYTIQGPGIEDSEDDEEYEDDYDDRDRYDYDDALYQFDNGNVRNRSIFDDNYIYYDDEYDKPKKKKKKAKKPSYKTYGSSKVFKNASNVKRDIKRHGVIISSDKDSRKRDAKIIMEFLRDFIPGDSKWERDFREDLLERWMSVFTVSKKSAKKLKKLHEEKMKESKKSLFNKDDAVKMTKRFLQTAMDPFYDPNR